MFGRSSISSIGGASAGALTASPAGRGNSGSTIAELWGRLERFHKMGLFVEYKVAGVTLAALLLILVRFFLFFIYMDDFKLEAQRGY